MGGGVVFFFLTFCSFGLLFPFLLLYPLSCQLDIGSFVGGLWLCRHERGTNSILLPRFSLFILITFFFPIPIPCVLKYLVELRCGINSFFVKQVS